MGQRSVSFVPGEFYHIYNRGNSKQVIYKDEADYVRFQKLLFLSNTTESFKLEYLRRDRKSVYQIERAQPLVSKAAYCLMPNHYHILLTPHTEQGVSLFMKKLGTGYAMYFNNRYDRTGSLFEGKFRSRWVDTDEYMKYVYAYIHLNPIKDRNNGAAISISDLLQYRFSSLPDYFASQSRVEAAIIDNSPFPHYHDAVDLKRDLQEWIAYHDSEQERPVQGEV